MSSPVSPVRIAVAGASGRMGQMLIEAVAESRDLRLTAALDVAGAPTLGNEVPAVGVRITCDVRAALAAADVLIDFTRPEGTLAHVALCRELGVKAVIGTTGLTAAQKAQIAAHAEHVAIVMAPNMSIGVNVTLKLIEVAARALDDSFDVEIVEMHHKHKVDAPSGTALKMGEVVAAARGRRLEDCMVSARHGETGERRPGTIGFASLRGGDVVGDHTVVFAGRGERIEITHRASSRATYAEGSLRAVRFLAGKGTGLFDMNQVLGLAPAASAEAP
jgi:4-hydroxy-tetrahydrodipicolinate reductase